MKTPIGICTCGNRQIEASNYSLITEHSETDLRRILNTDLLRQKIPTVLNENIMRSVRNRDTILLDGSVEYKQQINELALWLKYKWPVGHSITIKFLDRDSYLESQIIRFAKEWEAYANIRFDFISTGDAEVRISLTQDFTSWSRIGKSCLDVTDQTKPTMNFGWFNAGTSHNELRKTTLHEFGHVLGCIHEHQSPAGNIPWDINAIKRVYISALKYSEKWVSDNIINKLPATDLTNSEYDRESIMHYYFDPIYTLNRQPYGENLELSQKDKTFIGTCYPFN